MAYDLINIGTPNGNNGDTIRDAFKKSNDNDTYLKRKVEEFEGGGLPMVVSANGVTILTPLDAQLSKTGYVVGAIKITIPKPVYSSMLKLFVEIFDNRFSKSVSLIISGNTNPPPVIWYNPSVQIIASETDRNFTVRYGYDGTKHCIYIGELNSSWAFPKVAITKVMVGHGDISTDSWLSGWSIALETSTFQNIKHSLTNNLPV